MSFLAKLEAHIAEMPTTASWSHANVKSNSRGKSKTYVGAVAYITGERSMTKRTSASATVATPGG